MKISIKASLLTTFLFIHPVAFAGTVKFEGRPRSCAGGIENESHQFRLRVKGLIPHQKVHWAFMDVTRHNNQGALLRTPRLFDGQWHETIFSKANARGEIFLRVLSGQAVEKPWLIGSSGGKVMAKIQCDFDAPELLRRFPESFIYDEGRWSPPAADNGFLFDNGLGYGKAIEHGKVYLKFRIDPNKGDIDGNWRVVNGHQMRFDISNIGFNTHTLRSDGVGARSLNDELAPYATIDPKTRLVLSKVDGSAAFVMRAGPKYKSDPDDFAGRLPQVTAAVEDTTIFFSASASPVTKPFVPSVISRGPEIEWLSSSQYLRGQLLLCSKQGGCKYLHIDGANRQEITLNVPKFENAALSWTSTGSRFCIAFSDIEGYHPGFSLYDLREGKTRRLLNVENTSAYWGAWSPSGRSYVFERGSYGVSAGFKMSEEDPALYIWNGSGEVKLPINSSFDRVVFPRAVWNGEHELFMSLRTSVINADAKFKGEPRIVRVRADGKKARTWMEKAWNPLVSPDGKLVAFFGPESARQKPSQYWTNQPVDQSLCVSRMDKKPLPDRKFGYRQRRPLERFDTQYPSLFWSYDSKFLFAARDVVNCPSPFVDVWRFNVANGTRSQVARFEYEVSKNIHREEGTPPQWEFGGLSRDGKFLFLTFEQYQEFTKQWFRLNLTTGELEKLAIFRGCDFAWQDSSRN